MGSRRNEDCNFTDSQFCCRQQAFMAHAHTHAGRPGAKSPSLGCTMNSCVNGSICGQISYPTKMGWFPPCSPFNATPQDTLSKRSARLRVDQHLGWQSSEYRIRLYSRSALFYHSWRSADFTTLPALFHNYTPSSVGESPVLLFVFWTSAKT